MTPVCSRSSPAPIKPSAGWTASPRPFPSRNGRVGRLLITFLLVHRGVLHRPLLYLSHYLKRHRSEYYDRLMAVGEAGDWEGWIKFFLRGVAETAEEATETARAIVTYENSTGP